ncbi:MAG TPA: DegV family protein [Anaerolineae bacterium]|nr:DegV family protein [Anaerolineae bacterium]HQI84788.1 DegV family protein [Anaerolineae bacterium]
MVPIAVITDTDSSLPAAVAAHYGIQQVPINIHFGQETFQAAVNLNDAEAFVRIDRDGKLPTTSAPTPGQFAEAYQAAFDAGAEAVLCFCVSAAISGTYNAALTARELLPDRQITVVDSRTLSLGQGYMAIAAAEAVGQGASVEEAIAAAESLRERTHVYAALATLKYLAMSGRVGYLAAGMANLLNIKPILTVRDGKLDMLEKVRTQHKAWDRVVELTVGSLGGRPIERVGIIHVNAPEKAREFETLLRVQLTFPAEIITAEFTPGLSIHSGTGVVGVVVVAAK